jgi:hypothetical protein
MFKNFVPLLSGHTSYFLLRKGSTKTLKLTQFPLWTGMEECLTKGTAAGMRPCLIIPINAQYKGEWAAPPLLHTSLWRAKERIYHKFW